MRTKLALLILISVSGCATWTHPTKTTDQFHDDGAACSFVAGPRGTGLYGMAVEHRFDQCMKARGWTAPWYR